MDRRLGDRHCVAKDIFEHNCHAALSRSVEIGPMYDPRATRAVAAGADADAACAISI